MLADKVFLVLIASFGLELSYSWLNFSYWPSLPNVILFPYLYGPLFYIYTHWMSEEQPRWSNRMYLHFIPFALFILLVTCFDQSIYQYKTTLVKTNDNSWFQVMNFVGVLVSLVCYLWKIISRLKAHRVNVLDQFSVDSNDYNLSWIHYLTVFIFGGFSVFVAFDAVMSLSGVWLFESAIPLHVGIMMATYSLSFFGFRQEAIFEQQQFERYAKTIVESESKAKDEKERLRQFLQDEKPYLIRNLTLQQLSSDLSLPTYRVSELINNELGKNFFTLINELRIEEAKERILSGNYDHLTLSAIGFDSGFNSKSTFQAMFKKYTGMTPSQFKKRRGSESESWTIHEFS